jgi:hypothetical protein
MSGRTREVSRQHNCVLARYIQYNCSELEELDGGLRSRACVPVGPISGFVVSGAGHLWAAPLENLSALMLWILPQIRDGCFRRPGEANCCAPSGAAELSQSLASACRLHFPPKPLKKGGSPYFALQNQRKSSTQACKRDWKLHKEHSVARRGCSSLDMSGLEHPLLLVESHFDGRFGEGHRRIYHLVASQAWHGAAMDTDPSLPSVPR